MDFDRLTLLTTLRKKLSMSMKYQLSGFVDINLTVESVSFLIGLIEDEINRYMFTPSLSGDEDIKIKKVPYEVDIPEFLNMKGENNNGNKNYL